MLAPNVYQLGPLLYNPGALDVPMGADAEALR